jgi:hypothetical protein
LPAQTGHPIFALGVLPEENSSIDSQSEPLAWQLPNPEALPPNVSSMMRRMACMHRPHFALQPKQRWNSVGDLADARRAASRT